MDEPGRGRTGGRDGESAGSAGETGGRAWHPTARGVGLAFALALAGTVLGGAVPLLGGVGRFLGLAGAAFALGLVGARRRYVAVGLAGAVVAGLGTALGALGPLFLALAAEYGVALAGVGAAAGLVVSLLGHYAGRDLRAGVTRDL